jgi:hypothetical protein
MTIFTPLISQKGKTRQIFLYLIEALVVVVLSLAMVSAYNTFIHTAAPIKLHDPAIISANEIHQHGTGETISGHEVHIARDVTFLTPMTIRLETELMNKQSGYSVDLPVTKISSNKLGTITTQKLYYVSHLSTGVWCMQTTALWTPFLSLKEQSIKSEETCFNAE